jgi:hypothetical protein
MADWYCYKDKVAMVESELTLTYMQMNQSIPGLKCPKCDAKYLTESIVTTIVRSAESIIEEK